MSADGCLYSMTFQDDSAIITRDLVLARNPIIPRADKPFKTSIVFTLQEGLGVLFKALAVFALRGINLTKIGSRSQRKCPLRVVDDSNTGTAKFIFCKLLPRPDLELLWFMVSWITYGIQILAKIRLSSVPYDDGSVFSD
ncbi:hypothetical protein RHMOL_Rhmol08G0215600 [Rhododendron molle]|uniref:Uncharacterized protein n=1 Tax=Rhododendron molle TaxID=49168 RepID=A0ACC0MS77_RHOML|nr:hypothetical protein RHMOL_Rhmol08G0215600 [Rhododendron molle]